MLTKPGTLVITLIQQEEALKYIKSFSKEYLQERFVRTDPSYFEFAYTDVITSNIVIARIAILGEAFHIDMCLEIVEEEGYIAVKERAALSSAFPKKSLAFIREFIENFDRIIQGIGELIKETYNYDTTMPILYSGGTFGRANKISDSNIYALHGFSRSKLSEYNWCKIF